MSVFTNIDGVYAKDEFLRDGIQDLKTTLGFDNILGLEADFENYTVKRLCAANGLNAGNDFNRFPMYGNRKLCNLADDGTVNAWYGDANYTEDGSNGQVMVWQPKFYYKVVPIKMDEIQPELIDDTVDPPVYTEPEGYNLRKTAYFISSTKAPGFKCHPAFLDAEGNEMDGYYIGAYEGSLYDASESEYRKYDSWNVTESGGVYTITALNTYLADANNDKLCSIAGVKPASGEYSTQFTRPNVNKMGKNRGNNWGGVNVQMASAEMLLFIIEYAMFNTQTALGNGVVSLASGSHNESVFTGSTASLGNGSGAATSTSRLISDGTYETNTTNGKVSIRYRGVENFFGNMWIYIHGLNIHGNGKKRGGIPYFCNDGNYAESKNTDNYISTGITATNLSQYIKAFGWSDSCDWMFIPTETGSPANLTRPVGDYSYVTTNLNAYRIAYLGGGWNYGAAAGSFYWHWAAGVGARNRTFGGRLACFYSPA